MPGLRQNHSHASQHCTQCDTPNILFLHLTERPGQDDAVAHSISLTGLVRVAVPPLSRMYFANRVCEPSISLAHRAPSNSHSPDSPACTKMAQIWRKRRISSHNAPSVFVRAAINSPTVSPSAVTGRRVSKRM